MNEQHDNPETLVVPHDQPTATVQTVSKPEVPSSRQTANTTPPATPDTSASSGTVSVVAAVEQSPAAETNWFRPEQPVSEYAPAPPTDNIDWTASEFIAHDKSIGWYMALSGAAIVGATLMYVITRDVVSTSVVVFAAVMFGILAARKPRTQHYSLTSQGLQIGQKLYSLGDFKTFSLSIDGAIASIVLSPLKRFMPPLTVYVAPELQDTVVNFLSAYLPFEHHKADAVDNLLKRIRF